MSIKKQSIRDFLAGIASEVMFGKKYSFRIEIDDGGDNSYIGFDIDIIDWVCEKKHNGRISKLKIYRHTNSTNRLINTWEFSLGATCNEYSLNRDIPLCFSSYGKTQDEAEAEAVLYFKEFKKLIKKKTSDYRIQATKSEQEERDKLLARLNELNNKMDGEQDVK